LQNGGETVKRLVTVTVIPFSLMMLLIGARVARAELDQSNLDGGGKVFIGLGTENDGGDQAQTFEVGRAGFLDRVDVYVIKIGGSDLSWAILDTDASGVPSSSELASGSRTVIESGYHFVQLDGFSLPVTAGETLAIALAADFFPVGYSWRVSNGDDYADGQVYHRLGGSDQTWQGGNLAYDANFRTYVTVPEPSTLLLCIVAVGVVGGWRKWGG
jgi:hypothetical protein